MQELSLVDIAIIFVVGGLLFFCLIRGGNRKNDWIMIR